MNFLVSHWKKCVYLHRSKQAVRFGFSKQKSNAQVAELVDALVSNTNEVKLVPVRSRPWVQKHQSKFG